MSRICYIDRKFNDKSLHIIRQADSICASYAAQGYDLTLRQLYYQFVARGLIPNKQSEYKRLGSIINDARLAGLLDWDYIVDRTRNVRSISHWESPRDIVRACANQFAIDRWETQPLRIEVWIEKDALVGVIEQVCRDNDISYFACRGYVSQSEVWGAAQRLRQYAMAGQGLDFEVRRIALTWDQVQQYTPPPNPAKLTDSRADGYISAYGFESWELDALNPQTINALIQDEIDAERDPTLWDEACELQDEHRSKLHEVADGWTD